MRPTLDSGNDFDMALERSNITSPAASPQPSRQVAISIGETNEFEMEFERTGPFMAPPTSGRPIASGSVSNRPNISARPASSGLDVAYQRSDLEPREVAAGPSSGEKIAAYALTAVGFGGAIAALWKVAHRHGGRSVSGLLPHAFDASSSVQSGAFALGALVAAIALGFVGLKTRPRSNAMIVAAGMLIIASLAMVTVTLVSLDEHPQAPDGALLIPYVLPLALLLFGVGIAGRGVPIFLRGGIRRGASILVGAIGGALVFGAIELSAIASRFP